jgi:hypothetical protein
MLKSIVFAVAVLFGTAAVAQTTAPAKKEVTKKAEPKKADAKKAEPKKDAKAPAKKKEEKKKLNTAPPPGKPIK